MRAMNIRVTTDKGGLTHARASFEKNYIHYLQEALGIGIFMISACFFGALLEASRSPVHQLIASPAIRMLIMGLLMGGTALSIFYAPFTAPSGSHINPAVTLTFLRMGKVCPWDALFYILFQFAGGLLAVYLMAALIGSPLTEKPVHFVATIPGKQGPWVALATEFATGFIMMNMVLFSTASARFSKYTRIIAACLVSIYVIVAGPLSGFGMNPARTFASALPSGIWTSWWIYMIAPVLSMLSAAELFNYCKHRKHETIY